MYSIALLTISFAILGNTLPQAPQNAPSQSNGGKGKGAPKGGGARPRANGQDLSGLAEFLKDPSIPKMLGSFGITGLDALWKVPDIQKYAPKYLDFRNISNLPFVVAMPNGPAPTGCSPYEMLIGMFRIMFSFKHITFVHSNQSITNFSSRNWRARRIWIYCWRPPSEKG